MQDQLNYLIATCASYLNRKYKENKRMVIPIGFSTFISLFTSIHLSSSASSVTFGTAKMVAIKAILLVDSKIARARIKDFEKITL